MKFLIGLIGVFLMCDILHADNPSRISQSDPEFTNYRSSFVAADQSRGAVSLSTGIVALKGVWISSPGVNSLLTVTDNWLAGISSSIIDNSLTNTQIYMPFDMQSSTGVVFISTCNACLTVWSMPALKFIYRRLR